MAQHENKVTIKGTVVEIQTRTGINKNNDEYIGGKIMVEAGKDNIIPVDFYANKMKKSGGENSIYKSLQSVVQDYKTIAANGRDEADTIEVGGGNLQENTFYVQDGNVMIRGFNIQAPFFNRKQINDPSAEFIIVGEIVKLEDEIKKEGGDEVPTGNAILTLLVVGYNNTANLLDFHIEGEKAVAYAKANFAPGLEVKINGEIQVIETVETTTEEVAIGEPIVEEKRRTERKLILKGATAPVDSSITSEDKETMLANREADLKKKKESAQSKAKGSNKKASAGNFSL